MAGERFRVYLVQLEPTVGSEIRKTRPCVVVSPEEMNRHLRTVLVAPMTTKGRPAPFRVRSRFRGRTGQIALDQLRVTDRARLVRHLGQLDEPTGLAVLAVLRTMFTP